MAESVSRSAAGQMRLSQVLRQPRSLHVRLPSLPLGQQLTLLVGLPLTLLSLLVGLLSAYEVRQVAYQLVLERHTALAGVAAAGVSQELTAYLPPLETVAQILGHQSGQAAADAALGEAMPYLARFDGGVLLLDAAGRAIATSPDHAERLGRDYAFRDYYRQLRLTEKPVFSAVLSEQPSGQPAVVIAVPVLDGGRLAGVLTGVLFLERHPWPAELGPLSAGSARRVYLVDSNGTVIYHPDAGQVGGRLADPVLGGMVAAGRSITELRFSGSLGKLVVTSYAPLADVGWGLIVEEPWDAILASANPWQWVVAGLLLLVVVLSAAILLTGVRWVVRPLVTLANEARQVTAGAPFRPLPIEGPQEVRMLIEVFNRMVSSQQEHETTVRSYAIQVVQSQEEERRRLARELHDETVQQIVGLVQRIELCRRDMLRDPVAARRRLDELQQLARQAVAELRRMSNDLRPLLLEDAGLAVAVQTLCDELGRAMPSARVHCEIVGDPRRLSAEQELTVFRIVQEALTNVRKHATSACHVAVTLYYEGWGLLASIEDDGPGFTPAHVHRLMQEGHLGLAGMHERARLIAGDLTITSSPSQGASVTLRVASSKPSPSL